VSRFFIDRPIFAWVLAIIIMVAGAIAITRLPVAQYPNIAPPAVTVSTSYPGASAQVVEQSVTQIIEQGMKGLDGLLYMSATSESSGQATITLTFESGTDPDIAQVQVQNKLQLVTPLLPQIVQLQGINVSKSGAGFLMVVGFVSEDGSMGEDDIADFVAANIVDPIARVPGVGNVQAFGTQYAMRIWLDPGKLETYRLTPDDVISQIRAQNQQVAIGQLGGTPAVPGQQLNAAITAQGRLQKPEEFRAIVLRGNPDGSSLRLGDVARVELGAADYSFVSRYNGQPASGIAISLTSGANSIETSRAVEATLEQLKLAFPPGLKAVVPFDTTPFVRVAIQGVILTLLEAIALVFLVMYLFLQNFRATLIPTIAVPVVLLGTFAVLAALGYSVNMLTMFAMVLAIGLLVDDAIVVVENVERVMRDEGLSAVEATRKSMDQITGALVGIGLVLAAVFVPMAFLTGSTGIIYRQFSATIVSAMALSVLVALVLTPARTDDRAVPAPAQRIPAPGGPGVDDGAGDCPGRRNPAAHDEGHRGGRDALHERARGEIGLHGAGLQLRRQRPEYRHCVDQPEGLVGTQVAGHGCPGGRRSRNGRPDADQGCVRLRVRPASAARARHDAGVRLLPHGQRGSRTRGARRGAQPVPRRGCTEQGPRQRPAERPRGCAAAAHQGRPGQVGCAWTARLGHQRHARHRLGRTVHR